MYNELRKMGYKPMSERSKMRFRVMAVANVAKTGKILY
mgnify:CR=1 FL=1